ncbi:MAG: hypothetical protein NWF00_12975 [Candidatus Bathyarchaeota archaeon]|nr:hypothetical protein [Candidatus Bathyarchaeota archaeon]
MTNRANSSGTTKISTFVLAAIYITLILSVVAIAVAIGAFYETGSLEVSAYLLAIGFIALALSGYYLLQSRRHVANLKIETPQILTTVECVKCGIKSTREFQRGDYVYKELDKCTKCDDMQVITAIYREPTAKEKEKTVNRLG